MICEIIKDGVTLIYKGNLYLEEMILTTYFDILLVGYFNSRFSGYLMSRAIKRTFALTFLKRTFALAFRLFGWSVFGSSEKDAI